MTATHESRSNSAVLRSKMAITGVGLQRTFTDLWARENLRQIFPPFLVMVHQIIRASVPLMMTARDRADERKADDLVCAMLVDYFDTHIMEETDHDAWALDDLKAAGVDGAAVVDRMPPPEVAQMVGAQYYWIHHHHPVALLGYIAVLEGDPPSPDHIDRIEGRSGLPSAAFRTYRYHARVDPHHRDDLDGFIDRLPLSRDQMGWIGLSALSAAHSYRLCVEAVAQEAGA